MTGARAADWNSYDQRPYRTASLTHRCTASVLGLDLLAASYRSDGRVAAIQSDVLALSPLTPRYQVVYSVGLIEHFDRERTALAIDAHFRPLRPGSTAIVTFPTPTLLYRSVRRLAEMTGNWTFHDERPIRLAEFLETAGKRGEVTYARILWPLVLTQYCVAIRTPRS